MGFWGTIPKKIPNNKNPEYVSPEFKNSEIFRKPICLPLPPSSHSQFTPLESLDEKKPLASAVRLLTPPRCHWLVGFFSFRLVWITNLASHSHFLYPDFWVAWTESEMEGERVGGGFRDFQIRYFYHSGFYHYHFDGEQNSYNNLEFYSPFEIEFKSLTNQA